MDAVHMLMQFGLSQQEARLYTCLHSSGQSTGYELAKLSGISRSNTYAGLSSLVEKGGARLIDGKPARYQAVPAGEFCENTIRRLSATRISLEQCLPETAEEPDAYLTIRGEKNIRDKIDTMIATTERHIYLSMQACVLEPFLPALQRTAAEGRKVVVITDGPVPLESATLYLNPGQSDAIRVISDTRTALTGSLSDAPGCSCLYSSKQNLVELLRDSMRNEIKLIQLEGGRKA